MVIYTSCFANLKNCPNPISIALSAPAWFSGPTYFILAPTREMINMVKDSNYGKQEVKWYTDIYNAYLSKLNKKSVIKSLFKLHPGAKEITLLCWEKSNAFCHRHLVADWLSTEFQVKEI